jgi:hypothetical protein
MPGTEAAHEWLWGFEGTTLELTENYETRNDPNFKYNNGNVEPHRGFGHVAMMVWRHAHVFCPPRSFVKCPPTTVSAGGRSWRCND